MAERVEGTVVRVCSKGFGFIAIPNEADVFLHCTALHGQEWSEALIERRVSCEVIAGGDGRRRAIHARLVEN